jgi:hypothetical protein
MTCGVNCSANVFRFEGDPDMVCDALDTHTLLLSAENGIDIRQRLSSLENGRGYTNSFWEHMLHLARLPRHSSMIESKRKDMRHLDWFVCGE